MSANNNSRGKGEVEEVSFKPAKGGVVSETRMKFKRGGQGGGPVHDYEHETAVHPTLEHAAAHLKSKMGDCFGSEESKEE